MFVDIHCHILPNVDDGAQTVEDSIAMAQKAVSEGISHILCTPHHNNGIYVNKKEDVIKRVANLQAILDEENIPVTLYEGQEIRLSVDLLKRIAKNDILFADLDDNYLLIEFPTLEVPKYAHRTMFELCANGYRPIIVHPERNSQMIKNPNLIIPFIEMGCLAQLTCGSYIGEFGKEVQKVSKIMLEHNMVHLVASDAHNVNGRSFFTKEAYEKLSKEFGQKKFKEFQQLSKKIINGDKITVDSPIEYKKGFKIFG